MPPSYGELEHRGTAPVAVAAAAGPAGQDQVWIGAASPLLSYSPGMGDPDQGSGWVLTSQGYIQAQGSEPASVTLCELTCRSDLIPTGWDADDLETARWCGHGPEHAVTSSVWD